MTVIQAVRARALPMMGLFQVDAGRLCRAGASRPPAPRSRAPRAIASHVA